MPQNVSGSLFCRSNFLACCLAAGGLSVLYGSVDPLPAGEKTTGVSDLIVASAADFTINTGGKEDSGVPVPPGIEVPDSEDGQPSTAAEPSHGPAASTSGATLDNMETVQFCLFALQDGARFLENVKTYSAVFNKQERINGDLSENQTIEMKIQHHPHFGVYMKWKNGDAGRQVLY
ncbi:MAG: DUF1571 domain-containing protein, partial [Planctomycetaceae bacterium]|nr:DUF1571 domain-containing protein [Planctomycetaceae bacterium]